MLAEDFMAPGSWNIHLDITVWRSAMEEHVSVQFLRERALKVFGPSDWIRTSGRCNSCVSVLLRIIPNGVQAQKSTPQITVIIWQLGHFLRRIY